MPVSAIQLLLGQISENFPLKTFSKNNLNNKKTTTIIETNIYQAYGNLIFLYATCRHAVNPCCVEEGNRC